MFFNDGHRTLEGWAALAESCEQTTPLSLPSSKSAKAIPRTDDLVQKRRAGLRKSRSRLQRPFLSLALYHTFTHTLLLHSVFLFFFLSGLGLRPYAEESSTNTGCLFLSLQTLRGGEAVRFNSGRRICFFSPNEEPALGTPTTMPFPPLSFSYLVRTTYVALRQPHALTHFSTCASRRANCPDKHTAICVEACLGV